MIFNLATVQLGAVHKRHPHSRESSFDSRGGGLSNSDILRTKKFFRFGRPHFLMQKHWIFWNYGESARTSGEKGWASADILQTSESGLSCADIL